MGGYISVTPACFSHVTDVTGTVLSYRLFYFLCASWTLAGAAEPVSFVILVYSARLSSDFYIYFLKIDI